MTYAEEIEAILKSAYYPLSLLHAVQHNMQYKAADMS